VAQRRQPGGGYCQLLTVNRPLRLDQIVPNGKTHDVAEAGFFQRRNLAEEAGQNENEVTWKTGLCTKS
jgi:hypothetical protein